MLAGCWQGRRSLGGRWSACWSTSLSWALPVVILGRLRQRRIFAPDTAEGHLSPRASGLSPPWCISSNRNGTDLGIGSSFLRMPAWTGATMRGETSLKKKLKRWASAGTGAILVHRVTSLEGMPSVLRTSTTADPPLREAIDPL